MIRLILLALLITMACSGCTTLNLTITSTCGNDAEITTAIEQPKTVTTEAVNPSGNTVPISAMP